MRKILISFLLILGLPLFAGDVSSFLNMGFSSDSSYFMFGQHGVDPAEAKSYAQCYIIDMKTNNYAKGGKFETQSSILPGLGMDAVGGILNIVRDNNKVIDKYEINHLVSGKVVYFLAEGIEPKNSLNFRIFEKNSKFKEIYCDLKQGKETLGGSILSWFYIDVKWIDQNGESHWFKVGHPQVKRKNINSYYIKNIMLAPDNKSLVFVIAKEFIKKKDVTFRYMVECVQVK